MKKTICFVVCAGVFFCTSLTLLSVPVRVKNVEGKAAGNMANARELALTDALREAVRRGVGVDLIGQTKVEDFILEYDRVFAASFGYVRDYTVTEAGLSNDGIYRVKINATVDKGAPVMKDLLALKMIVRLKGSPRVALEIDELIEGVPAGSDFSKAWFEKAARDMQMHLIDPKRVGRHDDKLARRDELFGDKKTADLRRADIAQEVDFIIQAKVRGDPAGQPPYGLQGHMFAMSTDLRAFRPDTGAILVSIPMPTRELMSQIEAKNGAVRDIVHKMLAGSGDLTDKSKGAWMLFRKIFVNWIAELDLGTIMRLEFKQITNAEFDKAVACLSETPKVTSVWPREFDSKGLSFIDVETRLDATGLKTVVLEGLDNAFALDHATKNYLQFARKEQKSLEQPPSPKGYGEPRKVAKVEPGTKHLKPKTHKLFPPWAWALIGAGVVVILIGVYMMGKKGR